MKFYTNIVFAVLLVMALWPPNSPPEAKLPTPTSPGIEAKEPVGSEIQPPAAVF